ncbi:MAG: YqiA/YcfP family alpha/beta fold hydrolase [Myxococcota bacterium]
MDRAHYSKINEGLALYARGQAWDAHESWESVWKQSTGAEKAVLQVLIQVAAAVVKHQQDTPAGVRKNLKKATDNLDRVPVSACLGIDLVDLRGHLDRALAALEHEAPWTPPPLPARTGPDGFIYLHGFASSPASNKAQRIVPPLTQRGWTVSTPDLNEDDFTGLTISRSLRRVRRLLRDRTIIIGSSLGGYLAALLQAEDDRVVATVMMAPAFDFAQRLRDRYGEAALAAWAHRGTAEVEHYGYGRNALIGYELLADAEAHRPRPPFRVPAYVLQGQRDDVVPASMVAEAVAQAPAGLVEYDEVDDDHALGESAHRARSAAERWGEHFGFESDLALTP